MKTQCGTQDDTTTEPVAVGSLSPRSQPWLHQNITQEVKKKKCQASYHNL
jgi:hypothetical protein